MRKNTQKEAVHITLIQKINNLTFKGVEFDGFRKDIFPQFDEEGVA